MHVKMSQQLREETKRFRLVYTCDDCVYLAKDSGKCSMNYPPETHRKAYVEALKDGERVYFCKMFEAT